MNSHSVKPGLAIQFDARSGQTRYMFSLHRRTRLPGPNIAPPTWCSAMLDVRIVSNAAGGSPRLASVNTPPRSGISSPETVVPFEPTMGVPTPPPLQPTNHEATDNKKGNQPHLHSMNTPTFRISRDDHPLFRLSPD